MTIKNTKPTIILTLFVVASFCLFLFLNIRAPLKIQGDGVFYYSWLHSAAWDKDLDFSNQLAHFADYDFFSRKFTEENVRTAIGMTPNPYALGTAIMWLPFVAVAHFLTLFWPGDFLTDGYSYFYVLAINFASWFYGLAALWLLWRMLKNFFSERAALLSSLSLWLATPWVYYQFFEPSMSHSASLFLSAAWLWLLVELWRGRRIGKLRFVTIVFLLVAVRWQNVLFLIAFLPFAGRLSKPRIPSPTQDFIWPRLGESGQWKSAIKDLIILLLPLVAFIFLQAAVWKMLYGEYFLVPQGHTFVRPEFHGLYTLFSTDRGLLLWSPVLVAAFVGLAWLWQKSKFWTIIVFSVFALQWLINSSLNDLGGGDAFGGRRFIETLPFLALPLSALLDRFKKIYLPAVAVVIILIFWNLLLIQNYRLGNIPHSGEFEIRRSLIDALSLDN